MSIRRKTKNGASCKIMLIRIPQTSMEQQISFARSNLLGFASSLIEQNERFPMSGY